MVHGLCHANIRGGFRSRRLSVTGCAERFPVFAAQLKVAVSASGSFSPRRKTGHACSHRRLVAWPVHKKGDRKSTRLNSSHVRISYAVFCLKKKKKYDNKKYQHDNTTKY